MLIFRRSLAAFFILVFVFFSVVTFTVSAFNGTFLKSSFYTVTLKSSGYDFVVNSAAKVIYKSDDFISRNFTETDLKREIDNVFTKEIFGRMMEDTANSVENFKNNTGQPLVISLKLFRESLLTLANNLAFRIFQNIKECGANVMPEQDINGLPTCVLPGTDFQLLTKPFVEKFEDAISLQIPDPLKFNLSSAGDKSSITPADLIKAISSIKYWLYGILLFILAVIALLIYQPFNTVLLYEGIAFFVGGLLGYLLSFGLESLPKLFLSAVNLKEQDADVIQFMNNILGFFSAEAQKMALMFLGFGALLIVVQMFIKKSKQY